MQKLLNHILNGGKISVGTSDFSINENTVHLIAEKLKNDLSLFDSFEKNITDVHLKIKLECFFRMCLLEFYPGAIAEFLNSESVFKSVENGFIHKLSSEELRMISDITKQNDVMIFHAVKSINRGVEELSFLFVSNDERCWISERETLSKHNRHNAFVWKGDSSTIKSIGVFSQFGGVIRFE